MQRIFEKFGAVENPSRRYSTGIGLTFCRMAVEARRGATGLADAAAFRCGLRSELQAHRSRGRSR